MATNTSLMTGKTCLVTGATSGIGEATAFALARMGAQVVVAGRDARKAAGTVARIRRETGNEAVEYLLADLSAQAQVRGLAAEFERKYARLDVLVNNAGVIMLRRTTGVDGIEMTFAVNHLAYFLLTNLLLDRLKASAPARVVNIASTAHFGAQLDFDNLEGERGYGALSAYGRSKLANVLFTYELARRLEGTGVTANAVHPGLVATNLGKNNGALAWLAASAAFLGAMSTEKGARTGLLVATAPELEGVTGRYFSHEQATRSSSESYDEEVAARLWEVSAALTAHSA